MSLKDTDNITQAFSENEEMLKIIEEDREISKQIGFIGINFLEFINSESGQINDEQKKDILKAWAFFGIKVLKYNLSEKKTNTIFKNLLEFIKSNTTMDVSDINEDTLKEFFKEFFNDKTEALKSVLPEKHIKPNNKLANEITKDFVDQGAIELRVSRNGSKKEIITKAMLMYDNKNVSLSGRAKFTPYDREVHDGVATLCAAGNKVITPEMVYRAMNGMTETEKVSPQAVGAVTRSLDKSRRIMVNIDFSQEARAYKKDCKATYEGYLLACDKVTVSTGGRTKEAYKLLRKPILYDYAQISGQVISVPIKLLQTKENVRSTEDVIVIRGYLLRQIEGMKSPTFKRSNKIIFEGIYKELDVCPDTHDATAYKNKTRTIRQHVDAILKEWLEQKYINGYVQYKEGKTIKGITIDL